MILNLRFHRVLIGRESIGFDENFVALRCGAIERDHHQMQIDGERIHCDDFNRKRANQSANGLGENFMIRHPRISSLKMALDAQPRPLLQFLLHVIARGFGLQAKRMADEIDAV